MLAVIGYEFDNTAVFSAVGVVLSAGIIARLL
jgi:hypothetical protein